MLPTSRQLPLASLHESSKATASFPHPQVFRARWNGHPSGAAEELVLAPCESVDRRSCASLPVPRFGDFYSHPNSNLGHPSCRRRTLGGPCSLPWDRWTFPDGAWFSQLPDWDLCHRVGWAGGTCSLPGSSRNQIIGRPPPIWLVSHRDNDNQVE